MTKYTMGIIVFVCLAVIFVGDGWLRTRHAESNTRTLQSAIATLSPQELALRVRECEPTEAAASAAPVHAAAYCEEVMRAVDNQPLQIVTTPPTLP